MAASVSVHPARPDLLDELRPLFVELHRHHATVAPDLAGLSPVSADEAWERRRSFYESELAGGGAIVVKAVRGDALAGYAYASLAPGFASWGPRAPVGVIHDLVVAAPARRHGLGSVLLERTREELAARGASALRLNVLEGNAEAVAFYAHHGLVAVTLTLGRAM